MNLDKLQTWLQNKKIDVAFITDPLSISYFTGFEMKPYGRVFALVVFQDAEPFIFTPALNVEEAKNSNWHGDVKGYLDEQNPWQIIAQNVRKRMKRPQKWALEQNNLSVAHYKKLHGQFPDADFNHNLSPIIAHFRLYKTPAEIKELQAAGKEADYALKIGFQAIQTGISERSIAGQIDYQLKKQKGVMEESFSTIVQAGTDAADPHLGPTMKKIQPHELVLFDLGTMHAGYASDASRTVAYGTPTAKQKKIYQIDLEAQEAAMQAAKPGMTSGELDNVARKIIAKAGYGKYFIHRLGHGIGKYVHEFPDIVNGSKQILKPGMCFSIEPGIYIPGVAGVRIEDCGVLTEKGFRPFTHIDKHLHVLPLKN